MRLNGKMFKHPMDNNRLDIVTSDKGSFVIFNTTDGANIAYQAKYQINEMVDNIEFQLSKQDYTALSKLGEFDITIDGPNLLVKAERFSAKFTKYDGIRLELPNTKPKLVNVSLADIYDASKFVSDKHSKIIYHGVIVSPKAIVGTDSYVLFRKEVTTDIKKVISIPPLILKLLDKEKTYQCVLFGESQICFVSGNEAYFSNLYEGDFNDNPALFQHGGQAIVCNRNDLLKALNDCSMFASITVLSAVKKDDEEMLQIESLDNSKGSKYKAHIACNEFAGTYKFNIEMLKQVLQTSQDETVDIHVGNNRAVIEYENIKSIAMETSATQDIAKKAGGK